MSSRRIQSKLARGEHVCQAMGGTSSEKKGWEMTRSEKVVGSKVLEVEWATQDESKCAKYHQVKSGSHEHNNDTAL